MKCGTIVPNLTKLAVNTSIFALVLVGSVGCFSPSLAPMALQAGEMTGSGLISAVTGELGKDDPESQDRCDELLAGVPNIVELKMTPNGPNAWRQLHLSNSSDAPKWYVVTDERNGGAGWHSMANLLKLSFAPPLQENLKQGRLNYLVYAPAEPLNVAERDQLVALTANFGGQGTFRWSGRSYQYVVVNRLSCFAGPAVVVQGTHG
jgi:hypothetical protein